MLDKIAAMPLYTKLTLLTGLSVVFIGVYAIATSTDSPVLMASQQFLMSIMFVSMGIKEMKLSQNQSKVKNAGKGKLNYLLFFVVAAICVFSALTRLGLV